MRAKRIGIRISRGVWLMNKAKIPVAIIGSGNIGIDLCERLLRDPDFDLIALVGRRPSSPGLTRLKEKIPYVLSGGMQEFLPIADHVVGVFDATSAFAHQSHWNELRALGIWMIDLTPSRIGQPIVPVLVGLSESMEIKAGFNASNYSMVTCGGQSSAPLLHAITSHSSGITEVEVSSSIASLSAGPATRLNIDQYIESTEELASIVTGCDKVKAILVLNPADPPVMMRTTVTVEAKYFDLVGIADASRKLEEEVQESVPGYEIVVAPYAASKNHVVATARVRGAGFYLPEYAGNLDIINAAAVETARRHASARRQGESRKP